MSFWLLLACTSPDSGTETAADCGGYVDYSQLPQITGEWTTSFAQEYYDSTCDVDDFTSSSETWIGAFTISGSPPNALYGTFIGNEQLKGAWDAFGGVTFSGTHKHTQGTLYVNFTGLVYLDQYLQDRVTIDGSAFLGLDVDADEKIDCYARGSWDAKKSAE